MPQLTDGQIKKAYQNVFGTEPEKREVNEIKQTSSYWGDNARDVAERLMESPRFQNQKQDRDTISRLFSMYLGREPQESEITEIQEDNEYWGTSAQSLVGGLKLTQSYHNDPTLKLRDFSRDISLSQPDVQGRLSKEERLNRDLKSIGLNDSDIEQLNTEERDFLGSIGSKMLKNVEEGNPAPTTFNAQTFERLYNEAMEDEDIKEHYDGVTSRVKDQFLSSVADLQEDTEFQMRQNAREFQSQEDRLMAELEESGQAYSRTREEAEERLRNRRQDVIGSTRADARRQMRDTYRELVERVGTERASGIAKQLKINREQLDNVEGLSQNIKQDLLRGGDIEAEGFREGVSQNESQIGQQQFRDQAEQFSQALRELDTLSNPNNQ
jgi:uncharacterized protein YukE